MLKKTLLLFTLTLTLFAFDKSVANGEIMGNSKCSICSMKIKKYYKTSHAIVYKDGTKKHFCSIVCLKKGLKEKAVKSIYVANASTGKMIKAKSAIYVIGSDVPATMGAKKSKITFGKKSDAKAFQKKHGGIIGNYGLALKS